MNTIANNIVSSLILIFFFVIVPALLVWGWVRWARSDKAHNFASISSLIGFALATASAVLAIGSGLYDYAIGGFPFYDPRLMRIFGLGFVLSAGAFLSAVGGVWRQNPLRWHALICGIGTLFFWFACAMGE